MSLHSLRLVTQSPIPDALIRAAAAIKAGLEVDKPALEDINIRLDEDGQPVALVEADLLTTYAWAEFLKLRPTLRPEMQPGEVSFKGISHNLQWALHYVPEPSAPWESDSIQQTGTFKAVGA